MLMSGWRLCKWSGMGFDRAGLGRDGDWIEVGFVWTVDDEDGDELSDEENSGNCCSVVVLADVQVRAGLGRIRYQSVVLRSRG